MKKEKYLKVTRQKNDSCKGTALEKSSIKALEEAENKEYLTHNVRTGPTKRQCTSNNPKIPVYVEGTLINSSDDQSESSKIITSESSYSHFSDSFSFTGLDTKDLVTVHNQDSSSDGETNFTDFSFTDFSFTDSSTSNLSGVDSNQDSSSDGE